jgi:beta-glucosidase-like glycosyl hydrolase
MNEEGGARGDREAKAGVGGVFSLVDPVKINHFQKVAVEQSRLGIPILFAYDTIHGFRTIFPIPLATGSSFDPDVAAADHRIGARESAASGSSRSTARWSTSRTSRAGAASPRPPARTRT